MAKARIILDTRKSSKTKNDEYPIALRLYHQKQVILRLPYYTSRYGWDDKNMCFRKSVKTNQNKDLSKIEKEISSRLMIVKDLIRSLGDNIKSVSIHELVNEIKDEWSTHFENKNSKSLLSKPTINSYGSSLVERKLSSNKVSTAKWYKGAIESIMKFNNNNDIKLIDLDVVFLKSFEEHHLKKGNTKNAISAYLRALRAIYNSAIKEDVFEPIKNPFQYYQIPRTKRTKKRAIPKEEFLKIRELNYPIGSELWHSKNYALIMFNCRGMNFIDLVKLRVSSIEKDRLFYGRSKTGESLSVKLTQELNHILGYYLKGKKEDDFLFPASYDGSNEKFVEYNSHRRRTNKHLKIIAKDAGIESNLTTYSIRHSWATIAKYMGVPLPVISESLGHHSLKTTEIYLKEFDNSVLDDANQLVVR